MTNILITGETLNKVGDSIGYDTSRISLIKILDLEKLIELKILEIFKMYDIPEVSPVEVYLKGGYLVILSEENVILTNFFFKEMKIEKNRNSLKKYRLPPKK